MTSEWEDYIIYKTNKKGVVFMPEVTRSIPRPLVKTNQTVIVVSVLLTWITKIEWILLIPLLAGLSGILFGYNPIMQLDKEISEETNEKLCPRGMGTATI